MYIGTQKSRLGLRKHSNARTLSSGICGMDDRTLPKPNGLQNCSMDHVLIQSYPATPSSTTTTTNALESVIVPPPVNEKRIRR